MSLDPQLCISRYLEQRNLKSQSDELLESRFRVLANNLWSTDQFGRVIPVRSNEKRRALLNALIEVFAERIARGGPSGQFDEGAIREEASAAYGPPVLNRPFQGKPGCFAKFGKKEHIRDALNTGTLRVAPARFFNDPSLNDAQRDDELMHWARIPNARIEMQIYSRDSQGNDIPAPFKPGNLFRGRTVSDFYVWCCAWEYDARLFHEFKSQAVIVIRDEVKFRNRFVNAMRNLLPEWQPVDGPMSYYDPLFIPHERIVPIFYKTMRFLYQNEYRFAWRSPLGATPEQVLFPVLGPLNDIAEYYEIEDTHSGLIGELRAISFERSIDQEYLSNLPRQMVEAEKACSSASRLQPQTIRAGAGRDDGLIR